ncbi:MAG: hypothetical protein M3297_03080 [Thermoproteota archaeon]|nr:hypothetical protein [Thermoproteota archaeon]
MAEMPSPLNAVSVLLGNSVIVYLPTFLSSSVSRLAIYTNRRNVMIPMTANVVTISAHDISMSIVILALCYFQDDFQVPRSIPWGNFNV